MAGEKGALGSPRISGCRSLPLVVFLPSSRLQEQRFRILAHRDSSRGPRPHRTMATWLPLLLAWAAACRGHTVSVAAPTRTAAPRAGPPLSSSHDRRTGTDALGRRDITIPMDHHSTCGYHNGEATRSRVAGAGFDCRFDTQDHIWGFCETTVAVFASCGIAAACRDQHSCSDGCGLTGRDDLTTYTWYGPLMLPACD
ncbi:hypothetical protein VTK73DRAFT_1056 [Phialemonium thermophilum]|uniref:Uncharacterized protein n=1 Tax=Phialemonium thermophilum TaxID=223376 RepID=A0ABR3VU03_9PEZI